jgi:hypothetical protein
MSPTPWLKDELRAVAQIVPPVIMQFGSQQLVRARRDAHVFASHVIHLATSMLCVDYPCATRAS